MIEEILTRSAWRPSAHIAGADALEGHTFEIRFGETRHAWCTEESSSFFIAMDAFLDGDEVPVWSGWRELLYVEPSQTWRIKPDPETHEFGPVTPMNGDFYAESQFVHGFSFEKGFDDHSETAFGSYRFQLVAQ
jgi:hypothetical protein